MTIKAITNPLLHLPIDRNSVIIKEEKNANIQNTLYSVSIVKMPEAETQFAYTRDTTNPRLLYNEFLNVKTSALTNQVDYLTPSSGDIWAGTDIKCEEHPNLNDRSDAVVLSQNADGKITAIICDLKSIHTEAEKCAQKFILDKLHLDYLVNLVNLALSAEKIEIEKYVYVIFTYNHKKTMKVRQDTKPQLIEPFSTEFGEAKLTILKAECVKREHSHTWDNILAAARYL
jgi:hypothetical protein